MGDTNPPGDMNDDRADYMYYTRLDLRISCVSCLNSNKLSFYPGGLDL
jgi:hypothetical protein